MYCSYAQSTLRRLSKIRICFSTYDGMHTRCFSYGDHLSSNYLNQETDSGAKGPVNKSVLSTKEQSRFLSVVLECSGTSMPSATHLTTPFILLRYAQDKSRALEGCCVSSKSPSRD